MKNSIRKIYKRKREQLSSEEVEEASLKIANIALEQPIWHFEYYHIFLSISEQKEINTEPLLHILQGKDKNVLVPKVLIHNQELTHYLLTDSTKLIKNKWNIPEPAEGIEILANKIDVVFVPLLAFDKNGHRIGYGKGFYDKFLAACAPKTLKIGLSFFDAAENDFPSESTDIALNYCITPNKLYSF